MSSSIKLDHFELNLKGLNKLMKSNEMERILTEKAYHVQQNAIALSGHRYRVSHRPGRFIAFANVYPGSDEASEDNAINNTLLKALNN